MEEKATNKQVGGDHYKKCKIQPIEYIHANGLDFFQGNIVKYITRFRHKNGKQDLEKIKHYCDLLIDLEYPTIDDNTISIGDKFLCTSAVIMDDASISYREGKEYISEKDGCITDEDGDVEHMWTGCLTDKWNDYFVRL